MTKRERILEYVASNSGCTQLQIARGLFGDAAYQQMVNGDITGLVSGGALILNRVGGVYTYTLASNHIPTVQVEETTPICDGLSEDAVKEILCEWLRREGYHVYAAMGREHGIDITATRNQERWIIEVKGCGSRSAMRVNYFLAVLGETLQRMSDEEASYSIAFPDMKQFRGLWERLPPLAKKRTGITAIFVDEAGKISIIS